MERANTSNANSSNPKTPPKYFYKLEDRAGAVFFYADGTYANLSITFDSNQDLDNYLTKNDSKYFHGKGPVQWGRYLINGDTIKCQFFYFRDVRIIAASYEMMEIWYVIKNDSTISRIKSICKNCERKGIWQNDGIATPDHEILTNFVPFAQKPDSLCWLKEKKWCNCD